MQPARRRRSLFVGLFVVFCALLIVLIGGLDRVELRPGEPIPELFSKQSGAETAAGVTAWGLGGEQFRFALFALVMACLVLLLIGAILSPRLRRSLLIAGVVVAVVFLILMWIKPPQEAAWEGMELSGVGLLADTDEHRARVVIPDTIPPDWAVILVAVGVAAAAAMVSAVFVLKIYPRLRRGRTDGGLLEELAKRAGAAVDRIRDGADLGDAVRRCYKEMSELLCARAKISDAAVLTPREFADALRTRGMQDATVDRLTAIFEQVRYGGRAGDAFADEAIACLEAIQTACSPAGSP